MSLSQTCRAPPAKRKTFLGAMDQLFRLRFQAGIPLYALVSWPGGRTRESRKAAGEESPGSMETRCRL